jgi:acyl-homoserine lactone acylase PvdQ
VAASAAVQPFRTNDFGGFRNILPPGSNGLATGPDIALFFSTGQRPKHSSEQLAMYGDLVYATPGLTRPQVQNFFKDASFGVRPSDVERTYSPRHDVTILRDKGFGVPHVYGTTRAGAMFGAGYVGAEDRLFFMDVLRHLGRAQLSSFVGGADGNRAFDASQWAIAPYKESDLQKQFDRGDDLYGELGRQVQRDGIQYVAGINKYIADAKLNPATKMPGEYAAINRPQGPDPWKVTDVIATAALIGGIFGTGGGRELDSALILQEAQKRFGNQEGVRVFRDFRSAEDPEAPTTVLGKEFPYQAPPTNQAPGSVALPDPGSVHKLELARPASGTDPVDPDALGGLIGNLLPGLRVPSANSNALLVSARESKSGHPLAVFGPQTGYFAPQILMDIDIHAPGVDARGAAFPGINLYVQLGRGRDYAWSATSAGQDQIDTFAVDLCEPDGSRPTTSSMHYRFRGKCLPIEVLERNNSWTPSAADQTPAGSETLHAERTALGLVEARATISGQPVAYTKLRATYFHEADSAGAFVDMNNPNKIRNARDFQRAMEQVGYTFNWFYADDRDIAYFNSGNNPVRATGVNHNFPVRARFEWRDFNPTLVTADYTPASEHPQVVNQQFLTSWNNKQAPAYRASDGQFGFGSVYRSEPLDDRIRRGIAGSGKMDREGLIDAMETAGTVDLRAVKVLPFALRVLESASATRNDSQLAAAIARLKAWVRAGGQRLDKNRNRVYEHAGAIQILDAWWPLWMDAQFKPALGPPLFKRLQHMLELDNSPNNHGAHLGSAYQNGWYGYAEKDLRALLNKAGLGGSVRGAYSRVYCGQGSLSRCRELLAATLERALGVDPHELYSDDVCEDQGMDGSQWCFDAVWHRPLGAITQPLIHWINRPTFQQVVEVQGHRPR